HGALVITDEDELLALVIKINSFLVLNVNMGYTPENPQV
ncbi:hypothetical protein A2U01_0053657, partial [Trifolium medium]|nr:hypothetical protein [Trifolium medium]